MASNVSLSEKDFFDYVFNRSILNGDTINKLESDPALREKIEYYQELKAISMSDDLPDDILSRIALKIPAYREENVIELFPLQTSDKTGRNAFSHAFLHTFADRHKNYFIHIEANERRSKAWLFSPARSVLNSFRLTFFPSGHAFSRENNLDAVDISTQGKIDLIRLEF
ncbi:MAG: hypothetical protein ACM3Q2_09550 [Syntrophothermus sp.]